MGGVYPYSGLFSEFNFDCGKNYMGEPLECYGKSREAVLGMPPQVKMVFSGFEVGLLVMTGASLTGLVPAPAPVPVLSVPCTVLSPGVLTRATPAGRPTSTRWARGRTGPAGTPSLPSTLSVGPPPLAARRSVKEGGTKWWRAG